MKYRLTDEARQALIDEAECMINREIEEYGSDILREQAQLEHVIYLDTFFSPSEIERVEDWEEEDE